MKDVNVILGKNIDELRQKLVTNLSQTSKLIKHLQDGFTELRDATRLGIRRYDVDSDDYKAIDKHIHILQIKEDQINAISPDDAEGSFNDILKQQQQHFNLLQETALLLINNYLTNKAQNKKFQDKTFKAGCFRDTTAQNITGDPNYSQQLIALELQVNECLKSIQQLLADPHNHLSHQLQKTIDGYINTPHQTQEYTGYAEAFKQKLQTEPNNTHPDYCKRLLALIASEQHNHQGALYVAMLGQLTQLIEASKTKTIEPPQPRVEQAPRRTGWRLDIKRLQKERAPAAPCADIGAGAGLFILKQTSQPPAEPTIPLPSTGSPRAAHCIAGTDIGPMAAPLTVT